ncbi:MAG: CBS domain-containing protein [Rhodocyclaceae bacterium]|nr:CBS domain-containing protein [Rhodocyclaceae bacterium]MDZ4214065.1 CBS domain-containing protein [Rhodocyclaceae bacterium]
MSISGRVRDIMKPLQSYPHVDADATLGDVFVILKERYDAAEQFRSVLVLDKSQRLIGKISLHDLLHSLLPDYLLHIEPSRFDSIDSSLVSLTLHWQDDSEDHFRKVATYRVGAYAKRAAPPIAPDAPLTLALYLFANSDYNVIPVAENGCIVGVLRVVDLLASMTVSIRPD